MSENRCERCNRKLKDPNAQYGWRCAEILGVSESLNYSGDSAFDRYLSGIFAADSFLLERGVDKNSIDHASFYEAMAKRYLSADMHNHALWKEAYTQSENALKRISGANRTPLSAYFDLRDAYDYKNGNYKTTKYLDGEYSEDTKKLQHALNEIGIKDKFGNKLKEDGLYGPKTQRARDILFKGMSPSLSYIDLLQSNLNHIIAKAPNAHKEKLVYKNMLFDSKNKRRLFQIGDNYINTKSGSHKIKHINLDAYDDSPVVTKYLSGKLDHKKIPNTIYDLIDDFDDIAKIAKKGGKALTVIGFAFDAYDFGSAVYTDLNDEDKKLGKITASSAAGIAGSWAGGAAGAKLGAMGGAAVGTFILPGLGTAVGGFLGGLGGGMAGSVAGRKIGEKAVDLTYEPYKEYQKDLDYSKKILYSR